MQKGGTRYLEFEDDRIKGCDHSIDCRCVIRVQGVHICEGYSAHIKYYRLEDAMFNFVEDFCQKYRWNGVAVVPHEGDSEVIRLVSHIPKGCNITLVPPPVDKCAFPLPLSLIPPSERIKEIYKNADILYLRKRLNRHYSLSDRDWFEKNVWAEDIGGSSSLLAACIRKKSLYRTAFGTTNGRPHVVSAMADLYPYKFANAVIAQKRQVHIPPAANALAMKYTNQTLDLMYHRMGTRKYFGKLRIPVTLEDCEGMPLGTSAGISSFKAYKAEHVKVDASAKKYEMLSADLQDLLQFIEEEDAKDPAVFYKNAPKNENFFNFEKQFDDEAWEKFLQKLRLYVIPSSLFVLFERVLTKVRFFLERGPLIQIGHKWPHGGGDRIAKNLGINALNEMKKILVEADISKFDQSVLEKLINLYYSMGMVYDIPGTIEEEVRMKLTKFVIRNALARMTHLFGPIWGMQVGGVPSGKLDTSHCDSWVMAFWIFNYFVVQLMNAPEEDFERLENALFELIMVIVYGDDHAWNKSEDPLVAQYFSGAGFVSFMKVYFDVDVRDLMDGITFLSDTMDGCITRRGLTFLRHQFVLNPCKDKGQCRYLPFRETRDYIVRSAWGHESRIRNELDIMLSTLGHAYSTYASNRDAYDALFCIYTCALRASGLTEIDAVLQMSTGVQEMDLKELRRKGVDKKDLLAGFPSWQTLVRKNIWDESYHHIGGDISAVNDEEWVRG